MAILTTQTVEYESAATAVAFSAMTDAGAHTVYTTTNKPWSQASGYEPVIAPYGLMTGGTVIPAVAGTDDLVDVAALTAMMPGVASANATTGVVTVNAVTNQTCTRGSSTNTHIINSVTVSTAGAIAVVAGTATTAFSATRGAAGGPPFIPDGAIEIGQVRFTTTAAAAVASTEIYQVVGTHQERYDYPTYNANYLSGTVTFVTALPLIHTGSVPKKVYVRCATPVFAEISHAKDWVPAETANSTNSEAYYDGDLGAVSSSLGQASFTAALNDGVTDNLLGKLGQNLIFRFKPSRNGSAYQLTQGVLGVARTYGVKASAIGTFTVSPQQASVDFAS